MKKRPNAQSLCALRRNFRGATQLCFRKGKQSRSRTHDTRRPVTGTEPVAAYSHAFGAPSGAHSSICRAPPSHYRRFPLPWLGRTTLLPRRFMKASYPVPPGLSRPGLYLECFSYKRVQSSDLYSRTLWTPSLEDYIICTLNSVLRTLLSIRCTLNTVFPP